MANGEASPQSIPVEISLNEPQCDNTLFRIDDAHHLRIGTVEDIVAEKLRALLQQPIRNRGRRQDMLDISVLLAEGHVLNRERVAAFLLTKAAARSVPVSRSAFHDPEISRRAEVDYAALETTTRQRFIGFDQAIEIVLAFVDELPIPEQ